MLVWDEKDEREKQDSISFLETLIFHDYYFVPLCYTIWRDYKTKDFERSSRVYLRLSSMYKKRRKLKNVQKGQQRIKNKGGLPRWRWRLIVNQ